MDSTDMLAKRSEKVKKFFSDKTNFPYFILGILIVIGYAIRSKTLKNLIDPTTGNYIPLALDPFLFLRSHYWKLYSFSTRSVFIFEICKRNFDKWSIICS